MVLEVCVVPKWGNGDVIEADVVAGDGEHAVHELAAATRFRTPSKKTSAERNPTYPPCGMCKDEIMALFENGSSEILPCIIQGH